MKHFLLLTAVTALAISATRAQEVPSQFTSRTNCLPIQKNLLFIDSAISEEAQEIPSQFSLQNQLYADSEDPLSLDSVTAAPKQRLMPANLSIMEKALWGEDGIVRGHRLGTATHSRRTQKRTKPPQNDADDASNWRIRDSWFNGRRGLFRPEDH